MRPANIPLSASEKAIGRIVRIAAVLALGAVVGALVGTFAGVFLSGPLGFVPPGNALINLAPTLVYGAKPGAMLGVLVAVLFSWSAGARHMAAWAGRRTERILISAFGEASPNGSSGS